MLGVIRIYVYIYREREWKKFNKIYKKSILPHIRFWCTWHSLKACSIFLSNFIWIQLGIDSETQLVTFSCSSSFYVCTRETHYCDIKSLMFHKRKTFSFFIFLYSFWITKAITWATLLWNWNYFHWNWFNFILSKSEYLL